MPSSTKTARFTKHFSKPVFPALLLFCSIVLTIIAWYVSHNHLNEKTRGRFEYKVHDIHSAIQVRMAAYEQVLRGAVALLYAADTVSRTEWKNYVQTLQLERLYPGILGLGYTIRLSPGEVMPFTNRIKAEGFPDFAVWPHEPREEYFSIIYLEPFNQRNRRAFGFDMYTEQKRRQAMLRAMQTGEPALSQIVILVQETSRDVQKGCLLYFPVYDRKMSLATAAERQAALKGFVYSPFRINDLMKGILGAVEGEIEFEVYDGRSTDTARLFYASHGYNAHKSKADYSTSRILQVAGHDWTLVYTSRKPFLSTYEANQPNIIAVAGVLVNLLLLFILIKINSLSRRNRFLAERFRAEKDRYEIVSESTNDIIWEWNLLSDTVSFNKNFQTVTGTQLPVAGIPFEIWINHLHAADKDRVVQQMKALINGGKTFWSGEYRLLKADGSIIYILDRGRIIHDAEGVPVSMVGSMINITERRQAEEVQRRFSEELEKTVQLRTVELQRSNEDLERFAHIASHDLKEPVRKMLVFIDRLRTRHQTSSDEGATLLNKLARSASRLNEMIESILKFSTVSYESHKAEPVDLNGIVQNVTDDLELIIVGKGARIVAQTLPVIEGSPVLLHQLFYNLINNALKFAKAGVQLVINIEVKTLQTDKGELVEITLSDNGIGFSQQEAGKIFQSFVRLHSKDAYEGTGLGLALCKRIVERHGGNIEAIGIPNQGASFIIRLPKKQRGGII